MGLQFESVFKVHEPVCIDGAEVLHMKFWVVPQTKETSLDGVTAAAALEAVHLYMLLLFETPMLVQLLVSEVVEEDVNVPHLSVRTPLPVAKKETRSVDVFEASLPKARMNSELAGTLETTKLNLLLL